MTHMQHYQSMTYNDAMDFLRIADNAFDAGAYSEAAEIVGRIAYYAARKDSDLTSEQSHALVEAVKKAISRFYFCPDEACWEDTCGLMDLFR